MGKLRVFVVDDHAVVRQGLQRLVDLEKDMETCGEASNAAEALRDIPTCRPDVVLLDISLEGESGIELSKHIVKRWPQMAILVLSMLEESLYAERALRAGARGYIMKRESGPEIIAALRKVAGGKTFLSPAMAERFLDLFPKHSMRRSFLESLSDRELEVFRMIGQGLKPAAIAQALHLSVKTVGTYREQIKTKLRLKSAAELTQQAIALTHTRA